MVKLTDKFSAIASEEKGRKANKGKKRKKGDLTPSARPSDHCQQIRHRPSGHGQLRLLTRGPSLCRGGQLSSTIVQHLATFCIWRCEICRCGMGARCRTPKAKPSKTSTTGWTRNGVWCRHLSPCSACFGALFEQRKLLKRFICLPSLSLSLSPSAQFTHQSPLECPLRIRAQIKLGLGRRGSGEHTDRQTASTNTFPSKTVEQRIFRWPRSLGRGTHSTYTIYSHPGRSDGQITPGLK